MGIVSNPRVSQLLLAAIAEIAAEPFRLLFNGQIGVGGNAVSGETYTGIESMTNDQVFALFGANSDLTNRLLKAKAVCKSRFAIWVIALDPGAGTAATLDLAYTGAATEDKLVTVEVISKKQFSFNIAIKNGDTANDFALAVEAAIDALPAYFPATNAVNVDTLTLTTADLGTLGNKYTVVHKNLPAGLLVNGNTEESRDQFTGGTVDPVTTGTFDNVAATRFHTILWPWENDFSEPVDFLEPRNVTENAFLQGNVYIGYDDTEANIKAKVNGGTPLNSLNLYFMGNRQVGGVSAIVEPPDWRVAEFAAIEGLRLTDNASISQYVAVSAALDQRGGSALASLAYYATPLALTSPANAELMFDDQEQINLQADGYTIIGVDESVLNTIMGQVVSTYKFNKTGDPDVSFKFLNYTRTGWLILEIYFRTVKSAYKQSRLTQGDLIALRAIANQGSIEGKYLAVFKELGSSEFVLAQAGDAAEKDFSDNLVVTVDTANGRVTSSGVMPIVTQAREFNQVWQLAFTIGG